LHWHAHKVNSLVFIPGSPYLLSGGEEAVVVQWHLETQAKNFISRLGNSILTISLSLPAMTYYSVQMADNTVKIVRFDNNKIKCQVKSCRFDLSTL
jgi:NET1-associated nuclear protein 1 (U3 small nucleolar RNA-associated protein 17)